MAKRKPPATETEMYGLLRTRVCRDSGNGPATVLVPQVRSAAGFDARRTIDAVSLGLWPSRGMLLEGYEIKVSRSDWLRELKDPSKVEEFAGLVDRLWVVAGDATIVKDGELPERWGLLVRRGKQLRQEVAAQKLHDGDGLPPRFSRTFLVPLLRAANVVPPEAREKLREEAKQAVRFDVDRTTRELEHLRADVAAFEESAGVKLSNRWGGGAAERGAAFRTALAGDEGVAQLRRQADTIARMADRLAEQAREISAPEEAEAA